ncbi:MAG TPA: Fe(3+)-hydroxamate ABC transporter permease FhuB [Ensifer sp.]|nr:Fe(3+)-hydroxamate ABC transporter permease FhuB [Ensifer sp.]
MADIRMERTRNLSGMVAFLLIGAGLALFCINLIMNGPGLDFPDLVRRASADDIAAITVVYGTLPRLVVALAAGGLLGLAATLMRQGLQNPLAEPGTLGVLAAARFGVAVALIWFPGLSGLEWPVLLGCGAALALVLWSATGRQHSPLSIVVNGMVLGLCLDAATTLLLLSHFEELGELLIWQSGALIQDNWNSALILVVALALAGLAVTVLRRPMAWLGLNDTAMKGVGISPTTLRALTLCLATGMTAVVTRQIGIVGFVGLAGAALANLLGSRTFSQQAFFGAVLAASLLFVTDQAVQLLSPFLPIPTGAVTALLAAPLLLVLLLKTRTSGTRPVGRQQSHDIETRRRRYRTWLPLAALVAIILIGLAVGRTGQGIDWASGATFYDLLPFRWPRLVAALAAGGLLAFAGSLMQRLTGNAMASPELLGVTSGAALLMVPLILLVPTLDRTSVMLVCGVGAFLTVLLSLKLSARSGFAPQRVLIGGLAITAFTGSILSVVATLGDPRLVRLIGWLSGSTYNVRPADALLAGGVLVLVLLAVPLVARWLSILPLGEPAGRALGLPMARARLVILVLVALSTGMATILVGPVSFIGLIAPHLSRLSGMRKPAEQLLQAVVIGAALTGSADWLGRILAFPWELPAGLVVTVLGAVAYTLLMARR